MRAKKLHTKLKAYFKSRFFIILITIAYTAVLLVLLLNRFWQYEAFYYDHGMMEGSAYQVSQFKLPLIDREGKGPVYVDHFSPSMHLILAPFYWVSPSFETPLLIMALLVGISPLIAYEIGIALKISKIMVYTLVIAFILYIGTQNAILFLIHDVTLQIPFFLLLLLALVRKKFIPYYILLFINLGFKESFSITGITLGLGMIFLKRDYRKHAVATLIISLFYGLIVAYIIIPFFKFITFGKWASYGYEPHLANPIQMVSLFFNMPSKIETMIISIASFGFLPIMSPISVIPILQDFAQRFVLQGNTPLRTGLNLYYNANLAVILLFGSYLGLRVLEKRELYRKILILHASAIIVTVLIFHRFVYHGPYGLLYNRDFFKITRNLKFIDDFVNKIPRSGKIMTQNNLAVRFTHNDLYILSSKEYFQKIRPDTIAMDFRPGQNINNFWPMTEEKMKNLYDILLNDPDYNVLYKDDYRGIFVKHNPQ